MLESEMAKALCIHEANATEVLHDERDWSGFAKYRIAQLSASRTRGTTMASGAKHQPLLTSWFRSDTTLVNTAACKKLPEQIKAQIKAQIIDVHSNRRFNASFAMATEFFPHLA